MELDLRQLLRSARRWWWIVIAGPFLFGALAYGWSSRQTPLYSAESTLFVDSTSSTGALDYNALLTAQNLAKTYQKLIKTRPVLEKVIADLRLPYGAGALAEKIAVRGDSETAVLHITVSDADPNQAAAIANGMAHAFADSVTRLAEQSPEQLDVAIAGLRAQIDQIEAQIAGLQSGPNAADPATVDRVESLQSTLNDYELLEANAILVREQQQVNALTSTSQVMVWEEAAAPADPYSPRKLVNILLGLIAGGIVASGLILVLEYLDQTVKTTVDFPALAGGPLLASVTAVPKLGPGKAQLFVLDQPKGGAAESIRLLRTNIEFASAGRELATLGVSSPNPGEGKSTVAANLAVTLAQAGFVTALLDADLRRPSQHRIFGGKNDQGLSTLLSLPDRTWEWAAQETMVPNLMLIPSGPLPPNPADLLSLQRMGQLLTEMKLYFDVIVVDTPPILAVSDPLVVAAHVDGMMLVTWAGKTRTDALKRAAATLQRGSVRIVGVIVNQQSGRNADGYYHADYHAVEEHPVSPRVRREVEPARTREVQVQPVEHTSAD